MFQRRQQIQRSFYSILVRGSFRVCTLILRVPPTSEVSSKVSKIMPLQLKKFSSWHRRAKHHYVQSILCLGPTIYCSYRENIYFSLILRFQFLNSLFFIAFYYYIYYFIYLPLIPPFLFCNFNVFIDLLTF